MMIIATLAVLATAGLLATPYYFLSPLPAMGLLFFLALARQPQWGYYLLVFLIPFAAFRKLGEINIPWLVAMALILVLAVRFLLERRLPQAFRANFLFPLFLLLLVSGASAMLSSFPAIAYKHTALQGAAILFILLGLACLDEEGYRRGVPAVLVWSIALGSVMAVAGFYFNLQLFAQEQVSGAFVRGRGGAIDSNNLCLMTIFAMPFLVYRFVHAATGRGRMMAVALMVINLLAIVTTYSRSGFLVLLLCTGMLIIHYRQLFSVRKLGLALVTGMLLLASLLPMIPETFWERQASLVSWEDTSLQRRTSYLAVAWESFLTHPVLGAGPGTFKELYGDSDEALAHARKGKQLERRAHNTYLEVLVGTGVIGLTLFLSVVGRALLNFFRAEREFRRAGEPGMVALTASYRIAFTSLLIFFLTFSEEFHKYLLLSLPLSHWALQLAREHAAGKGEVTGA